MLYNLVGQRFLRPTATDFDPEEAVSTPPLQTFVRLRKGGDTWILDADIRGAFDNISHEYILKTIGEIPGRELIKQWLKAGYVEAEVFHKTESGTWCKI